MDGVALRRDAHHLRAAPGDRADIGFLLAVLLDDQLLGGVDVVDRIGDFEIEHLRRALQALGVLARLEDLAAIGALALEHAARVMQAVAEHVQIGVLPGHQLAVVPDDPFEPVIGLRSHRFLHQLIVAPGGLNCRPSAPVMAHFRASSNTLRRRATPGMKGSGADLSSGCRRIQKGRFGTILSSRTVFL